MQQQSPPEQFDLAGMVPDLNSLLRQKTTVIGMKLFATADEMAALVPQLAAATEEYADRLFEVLERMDTLHPTEPHWYLFFLATRAEWQSRGIGSALMRAVLETCDRDAIPAYLEATCERNKQLYLRHWFEVTGQISLADGVSLWPMWRAPARRTS